MQGGLLAWVEKDTNHVVGGELVEEFQENHAQVMTAEYWLQSDRVIIEAGTEICLKVGGDFVKMDAQGISIEGTMVNINCGGVPGTAEAAQPESPVTIVPQTPASANNAKTGQKPFSTTLKVLSEF